MATLEIPAPPDPKDKEIRRKAIIAKLRRRTGSDGRFRRPVLIDLIGNEDMQLVVFERRYVQQQPVRGNIYDVELMGYIKPKLDVIDSKLTRFVRGLLDFDTWEAWLASC